MLTAKERVQNGARLLDQYGPHNWRRRINPQRLDISCGESCILGQVYGHYHTGRNILHRQLSCIAQAADHGFDPIMCAPVSDLQELEAEWRAFLLEQQVEAAHAGRAEGPGLADSLEWH